MIRKTRFLFLFIFISIISGLIFSSQTVYANTASEPEKVRVGYYENEVFEDGASENAVKNGYAYEYYRKLTEYTGWEYDYVYGSFVEVYDMLLKGEVDVVAGLAYTDDRQGLILYPDRPMGVEFYSKSDGRISGYSAGLYATWYQNDANKTGAYVDSWALYNWFDNSVSSDNRSADDYDSRGVTASVEGGYTFEAGTFSGSEGTLNTWYVQPQAQITWMGVKDSDHTRKDGTRIETEGDGNVQTRLGVKTYLNSHHQRDDGKQREFQPYIEANWINNSKVYAVKMNGQTVGREGARNLGEVRTGVEAKVNNNLSLWGNVGVQLGDKGYSDTQGMLGVKYSW